MPGLMHTASLHKFIMDCGFPLATTSQCFVVREDYCVCLGIAFMCAILHPFLICNSIGVKTCDIKAKQVNLRRTGQYPFGKLTTHSSTKHHAHGVEPAAMVKATHSWIWSNQRFVIRSEGLRPT